MRRIRAVTAVGLLLAAMTVGTATPAYAHPAKGGDRAPLIVPGKRARSLHAPPGAVPTRSSRSGNAVPAETRHKRGDTHRGRSAPPYPFGDSSSVVPSGPPRS